MLTPRILNGTPISGETFIHIEGITLSQPRRREGGGCNSHWRREAFPE